MPLGPPEDPERFEDFDDCVESLSDGDDMTEEEAREVCGGWENEVKQGSGDTFQFWGIVHSAGVVEPVNIDHEIYYTEKVIQSEADDVVGTDVRLVHQQNEDADKVKIGTTVDYALLEDNQFVLLQIERSLWDNFVQTLNDENTYISISFNQLIEEIEAGNLALSAGLKNAQTIPTPDHNYTVASYDWKEISVVPKPASPGAWAWECDDQCRLLFGNKNMSDKDPELEPNGGDDDPQQGQDVDNPPQAVDTIQMGDEEYRLVPLDEVEQSDCNCNHEAKERELQQQLEQVEQERDKYKELTQAYKQERRERLSQKINQLNDDLPEDVAWEEDEVEQMCEEEDIKVLQAQVDTMERLAPKSTGKELNQEEEDLSGTSGSSGNDETEEMEQRINQTAQELFGKDLADVIEDTPENKTSE